MSHFEQIMNFKANPPDIENYRTIVKWNNEFQQLRVDRNQKLYTLTQPRGFLKVIYAVWNFFIKWFYEGWHADATLKERMINPMRNAPICEWKNETATLAQRIFNCCGVPCNPSVEARKEYQLQELQIIQRDIQELLVTIKPFQDDDRVGIDFAPIYTDLEKLSTSLTGSRGWKTSPIKFAGIFEKYLKRFSLRNDFRLRCCNSFGLPLFD